MAAVVRIVPVEDELVELQAFGHLGKLDHRHHIMVKMALATATTPLLRVVPIGRG